MSTPTGPSVAIELVKSMPQYSVRIQLLIAAKYLRNQALKRRYKGVPAPTPNAPLNPAFRAIPTARGTWKSLVTTTIAFPASTPSSSSNRRLTPPAPNDRWDVHTVIFSRSKHSDDPRVHLYNQPLWRWRQGVDA